MANWQKRFVPAIPLPAGGQLVTLADARRYILELPPEQQALPAWQIAAEALLMVGNHGGPEMLPRIGMMRALYPIDPTQPPAKRRKRAKAFRIIRARPPA